MNRLKALIVDDSTESRMLLGKILTKSFDLDIIEAKNGQEAVKKIVSENPHIVFLDYEMPIMNGKETLASIRSMPHYSNLPIVMVTSHSEKELVRELLAFKISAYLVKPLSSDYVTKMVSVILPKG